MIITLIIVHKISPFYYSFGLYVSLGNKQAKILERCKKFKDLLVEKARCSE